MEIFENQTIDDDLDLSNTSIQTLPDNLTVGGNIERDDVR